MYKNMYHKNQNKNKKWTICGMNGILIVFWVCLQALQGFPSDAQT